MRKLTPVAFGCLALASCASNPESDPAYVSPTQYDTYSCAQMRAEMQRVSNEIDSESKSKEASGNQFLQTALNAYAISQGYSFNDEESVELRRAKNKYRILDEMMIKKNCTN